MAAGLSVSLHLNQSIKQSINHSALAAELLQR